jgi:hypothetical protein
MVTKVKPSQREASLRILARMIVRAYLGEIERGEAGPNAYRDEISISDAVKHCDLTKKPSIEIQSENCHE